MVSFIICKSLVIDKHLYVKIKVLFMCQFLFKQFEGQIILLVQVDFAMDVFKNLYPDQDVPEGLFILLLFCSCMYHGCFRRANLRLC